jgi:hypothetical protein
MNPARLRTPYILLTKHFLKRFLENDLISPDADRSLFLSVVGAMVMSLMLFICVFMSFTYVGRHLTPGQIAVMSLDDKFFYLAMAMMVTALVAASQWDALSIDPRDAAILEPLPVSVSIIQRAKVSAIAILGAAVAIGVNVIPSVVFPWLLVFGFRQMRFVSMLELMVIHAVICVTASVFGYLVIIAIRETSAVMLGVRWFTRVSPWMQAGLIVLLGSGLLLLPPVANRIAWKGFDGWRAASPPMWFLGVYELAAGNIIAELPREKMTARQANNDQVTITMYRQRREEFPAMARRAASAVGAMFALAAIAYAWNARRLPSLSPAQPPAFRRRWRLGTRLANTFLVRDPAARAGFYFTLAAMWRSNTHRLTLAGAAAAGFAMAVLALSNAHVAQGSGPTARLLSMQPLLYGALLVGFRHVIRVPAELRANWGFQIAWRGRDRAFIAGVKHAAIVALVLPALAVLLPLFVFVLGPQMALVHAALGLTGATVLLEALMLTYDKVPFTCTYLPSQSMKGLAPIYVFAFLIGASQFARMQNEALLGANPTTLLVTLAIGYVVIRVMSLTRRRIPQIDFDESPISFQGLGL